MLRSMLRSSARALAPLARRIPALRVPSLFGSSIQTRLHNHDHHEGCHHEEDVYYTRAFVGKPAPFFRGQAVVDGTFKEISLSDYKDKYLVLFFYPLDFTFVCPTEIIDFSERAADFRKVGCEVVGASVDSHFTHLAWTETPRAKGGLGQMHIPLLSDLSKRIARDYGVLIEPNGFTARGTFIIDGKGKVRHISINEPPVGRNVDEVLRLVQAFQYTDKHGEVCPSGWKPGAATIKPNVKESKSYFAKKNE
eukprot:TRINITY_DN760_c0_g1_i3.p1 TRINITY_DN760_c0_g1~~TRINITY_DN760_c0_g1_i3.p1  ORF type:complete len:251 (+),score=108.11 TRINITY_DN760_c0_g1_i3:67-819(+)